MTDRKLFSKRIRLILQRIKNALKRGDAVDKKLLNERLQISFQEVKNALMASGERAEVIDPFISEILCYCHSGSLSEGLKTGNLYHDIATTQQFGTHSRDQFPWRHPYLTNNNIREFREYSLQVWDFARDYSQRNPKTLKCAFCVNMAQNMHVWAKLAQDYGTEVKLFPHPSDFTALNAPEWEEFDGEHGEYLNAQDFLNANPNIELTVPCDRPFFATGIEKSELSIAYEQFKRGKRNELLRILRECPSLRHEVLLSYSGYESYFEWAKELSKFDVVYAASQPFAAYASGRPYCVAPVGGDVQWDAGRDDDLGRTMTLSLNAAKFLTVVEPYSLGHLRRLGLVNGVFCPYPMDDKRYCPAPGEAREEWVSKYGDGIYCLSTSRIDNAIKGNGTQVLDILLEIVKEHADVKFIFLSWGDDYEKLRSQICDSSFSKQFIFLKPVGKKRLKDYYRSCDFILDQFSYGWHGCTLLEAAAVGKPVIMYLNEEMYAPLYNGDTAPVLNAKQPKEIKNALNSIITDRCLRREKGREMRQWLVRTNGREKSVERMLSILRLTADNVPLPRDLRNPLSQKLTEEEIQYHKTVEQEACDLWMT